MFFQNIDVATRVYTIFGLEMVNGSTSEVSTEKRIHNKNIFFRFQTKPKPKPKPVHD